MSEDDEFGGRTFRGDEALDEKVMANAQMVMASAIPGVLALMMEQADLHGSQEHVELHPMFQSHHAGHFYESMDADSLRVMLMVAINIMISMDQSIDPEDLSEGSILVGAYRLLHWQRGVMVDSLTEDDRAAINSMAEKAHALTSAGQHLAMMADEAAEHFEEGGGPG